jgi:hypothetical protein
MVDFRRYREVMARSRAKGNVGSKKKPKSIPVSAARDGADLCLQCGLCCDGTVFHKINMKPDEKEYVESLGLPVEPNPDGDGVTVFEPCPAFVDGCCSLYQVGRPATCHVYRCQLLEHYEAGHATLYDCLGIVQLVWSLAREVEAEIGIPLGSYSRRTLQRYLTEHQPWANSMEHANFLVAFHRLDELGYKYFGYKREPQEVEATEAGAEILASQAEIG